MEAAKVIAGGVLGLGFLSIKWRYMDLESAAWRVARRQGLSMARLAPPGRCWGMNSRCDLWTVLGAFNGTLVGLGAGLLLIGGVAGTISLGVIGAAAFAWRYRVVTSILATAPASGD